MGGGGEGGWGAPLVTRNAEPALSVASGGGAYAPPPLVTQQSSSAVVAGGWGVRKGESRVQPKVGQSFPPVSTHVSSTGSAAGLTVGDSHGVAPRVLINTGHTPPLFAVHIVTPYLGVNLPKWQPRWELWSWQSGNGQGYVSGNPSTSEMRFLG